MVGASVFEIRPERVGESLQITSAMPTSHYQSGSMSDAAISHSSRLS